MDERPQDVNLELTAEQLDVVTTALQMLEATLGREEADELEVVQRILAKIRALHLG